MYFTSPWSTLSGEIDRIGDPNPAELPSRIAKQQIFQSVNVYIKFQSTDDVCIESVFDTAVCNRVVEKTSEQLT